MLTDALRSPRRPLKVVAIVLASVLAMASTSEAIQITLDFTLDEQNENWFDPTTSTGQFRRASVQSAADFLSSIITNDDWEPVTSLNESNSYFDIAAPVIRNIDGSLLVGDPEGDGAGYSYARSSNNVDYTNRTSVAANEYVVYVAAFAFDSLTTAAARGGRNDNAYRNAGGAAGSQFSTWGGRIIFNTTRPYYYGLNPGVDPTIAYGVQDSDKSPSFDDQTDNWLWSANNDIWKGFDLTSIDPSTISQRDLYGTATHELLHALGATAAVIEQYVGVDNNGDFIGPHLVSTYGGPVPGDGGHFAADTQATVWASDGIISEALLDPNSQFGVRKYLTDLDAALLRDLGYEVLSTSPPDPVPGDYNDDGTVDIADYTVWRDNLGLNATLPNDTTPGVVDIDDFIAWRAAFGTSRLTSTAAQAVQLPDPASLLLAVGGVGFIAPARWGGDILRSLPSSTICST